MAGGAAGAPARFPVTRSGYPGAVTASADGYEARTAARRLLGHAPHEGIEQVLAHLPDRDVLFVVPAGARRSDVFRLASLAIDGPTVGVSPTVPVQVQGPAGATSAAERGPLAPAVVDTTVSRARRRRALLDYAQGRVRLLLLTPEQLARADVLTALRAHPPALLVVDDGHLVADWGPQFRPHYLRLAQEARALEPRLLVLTTTTSAATRAGIAELFGMRRPAVVRGADRPTVRLAVRTCDDAVGQRQALIDDVLADPSAGMVYVPGRRDCVRLAADLSAQGVPAVAYHGGLSARGRASAREAFAAGCRRVLVTTSALGLDIDEPVVGFVHHLGPSASVDAYVQEVARAGHDGRAARAVLFVRPAQFAPRREVGSPREATAQELDRALEVLAATPRCRRATLARATAWSRDRLSRVVDVLEAVGAVRLDLDGRLVPLGDGRPGAELAAHGARLLASRRRLERGRLQAVRRYAESDLCRRSCLLELLGEDAGRPCEACDNCERAYASPTVPTVPPVPPVSPARQASA